LHVDLDDSDFLAVFPLAGQGRGRLIGTVKAQPVSSSDALRFEDVNDRAIRSLKLEIFKTNWFSTYRVHHRVADHFRKGRAFLLGDAAHIHSPAGGQGMNTGIGDAINLAWKLKAVLDAKAPQALLDSYESERIGFARRLVATTDKAFRLATAEGGLGNFIRLRVAPTVLSSVFAFETAREFAFRTVSQVNVNYRGGPLSAGKAGGVHGGDRLPWVAADGADNHQFLSDPVWQAHVYGEANPDLRRWCASRRLPLHAFVWTPRHGHAGIAREALFLMRPDSYVALAQETTSTEALDRYFGERGLSP
jgi:hypothetical protein